MRESEERYRGLSENMLEGLAHCQMLYKSGAPSDFVCLAVNERFEALTGLKDATGKFATSLRANAPRQNCTAPLRNWNIPTPSWNNSLTSLRTTCKNPCAPWREWCSCSRKKYQGQLDATAELGQGTKLHFTLPDPKR